MTAWRTRSENGVDELFPRDESRSLAVETTKEVHVLEFVRSSPRHIVLSPLVEVEVL